MRRAFAVFALTLAAGLPLAACGSGIRGGVVLRPSAIPRGKLIATFLRTGCSDGRDANESVFIDYVQGQDGVPFLVERSRASEWLVVRNSYIESGEIVFQSLRENRGRALQEYRFPWDGRTAGRYSLAMSYAAPRGTHDRFRVDDARPYVICRLRRVDPVSGAPLDTSLSADKGPTALPGPATSAQGWGYDGKSFAPGDLVLIDVGGRATRGRVVQASGTAYLVHYEGGPEGSNEWVAPSRVLGQVK